MRADLTRRDVIERGMASFALLCSLPVGRTTSAGRRAQALSPFTPFRADLPVPPVLLPTSAGRRRDVYDLRIGEGLAEILPGHRTPVWGYDGIYPGPTIRARAGREVVVRQHNALAFEVNVHLHGGAVPAAHDGHPMDLIAPGGTRTYVYPNRQDAATLWYHDHAHGRTARSIHYGLAAFYLLEDDLEHELELPRGEFDVPLMIQDHAFNRDGSFRYAADVDAGFLGDTILVNGAVAPRMRVKRRRYRLRLLNASNAREYRLVLGHGRTLTQIGADGGLLERPVRRTAISLAPAERADVVVDFRAFAPGSRLVLRNALGSGGTVAVMRFDVDRGGGAEEARVPRRLRPRERIPRPVAERRYELSLATSGGLRWQMAGRAFDMERVDARPRLGTTERWRFVNASPRLHPMHLHGFHFRVAGVRGWKDTVAVRPGKAVVVQPYFSPYPGRFVFHCHALEHGDLGMMLQLEVER